MGENKKRHQPPMTIDEQIENLKQLGLKIDDEEYAKNILNDISYFRLIKAYSINLKEKNSNYDGNIKFEDIVQLYLFNAKFRQIIFSQIERIEINTRCRISNYFANKYGVVAYKNSENFMSEEYHRQFMLDVESEIRRNSKAPFVKYFEENYEGGDLPVYALVEIMSFGTLSKFYKNMKNQDKKIIARQFGVGYTYFESWLESISYVRNICAHYGRLYNAKLSKTPRMYNQYRYEGIRNNRIFGVLMCMRDILKVDLHWEKFVDEISDLLMKYKGVDIITMGFPTEWREYLLGLK